MNEESTFHRSSFVINSSSMSSPALQFYFADLLRDKNIISSSQGDIAEIHSPNLDEKEMAQRDDENLSVSCNDFEIVPDDAKSHLDVRTLEKLRATLKKVSSASRLDRWDCDEQNQIQLQQTKSPINIPPTQPQQEQQQHQKIETTEKGNNSQQQQEHEQEQQTPTTPSPNCSKQLVQKRRRLPSIILDNGENFVIVGDTSPTFSPTPTSSSAPIRKLKNLSLVSSSPRILYSPSSKLTSMTDALPCIPGIDKDEIKKNLRRKAVVFTKRNNSDSALFKTSMGMQSHAKSLSTLQTTSSTPTREERSAFAASESPNCVAFKAPERLPSLVLDGDDLTLFRKKQQQGPQERRNSSSLLLSPDMSESSNGINLTTSIQFNCLPLSRRKQEGQQERCNSLVNLGILTGAQKVHSPFVASRSSISQDAHHNNQKQQVRGFSPRATCRFSGQESTSTKDNNLVCPKRQHSNDFP